MTTESKYIRRVLLVEDSEPDARIAIARLRDSPHHMFEVRWVEMLAEALKPEVRTEADVILLDLNLPDSRGLETLERCRAAEPERPVVVFTGLPEEHLSTDALRSGAQDFVPKENYTTDVIARTLVYAIERHRLERELARAKEEARFAREMSELTELGKPRSAISSEVLGQISLKRAAPELFDRMVSRFVEIGVKSVRDQSYRVESPKQQAQLRAMAAELGAAGVAPQDIVDIYREALTRAWGSEDSEIEAAHRDEARILLIGLLGLVMAHYRLHALGALHEAARRRRTGEGTGGGNE